MRDNLLKSVFWKNFLLLYENVFLKINFHKHCHISSRVKTNSEEMRKIVSAKISQDSVFKVKECCRTLKKENDKCIGRLFLMFNRIRLLPQTN